MANALLLFVHGDVSHVLSGQSPCLARHLPGFEGQQGVRPGWVWWQAAKSLKSDIHGKRHCSLVFWSFWRSWYFRIIGILLRVSLLLIAFAIYPRCNCDAALRGWKASRGRTNEQSKTQAKQSK